MAGRGGFVGGIGIRTAIVTVLSAGPSHLQRIGTKIVMSTRNARKKLSPRSSTQTGNNAASVGFRVV
jgi:hypothetical protein